MHRDSFVLCRARELPGERSRAGMFFLGFVCTDGFRSLGYAQNGVCPKAYWDPCGVLGFPPNHGQFLLCEECL